MSEIEKMYKNAGIEQVCSTCELRGYKRLCPTKELCVRTNPPFTAEKQLELLKICFDKYERLEKVRGLKERCIIYHHFEKDYTEFVNCETWEETIAGLINNLWKDLTSEEKQQVKGILE